jgi:hypothetical protein
VFFKKFNLQRKQQMKKAFSSRASALLFAGLISSVGSSQAALVSIDNLTVSWLDATPSSAATIRGNGSSSASMFWGRPMGPSGQSGYAFTTASTPISYEVPPASPDFLLGSWTHYNNPITPPLMESVRLMLSAEISVDSVSQGTKNFYFDFTHNETPNDAFRCANGGWNLFGVNRNGCADIVDITYNDLSDSFFVDGTLFTLDLASGSTHFETVERWRNAFNLYASFVASNTSVPEPSTLMLLSTGLAFLGFARRRMSKDTPAH